jgi:hypothetical protein
LRIADFIYSCIIQKTGGEVEVKAYNSPYPTSLDQESVKDILFAINEHQVVDVKNLDDGKKYDLKMLCRMLVNGVYEILGFEVKELNLAN